MEFQQLHSGDRQDFVFLGAALISVGRALQDTHGALFASEFVEEYGSEIERAARRLRASRGAGTGGFWRTLWRQIMRFCRAKPRPRIFP
jgi:hypothetical protein